MRISDWSSDVCSSDLAPARRVPRNPLGNPFDLPKQDQVWYQEIIDQTTESTYLGRYGTLDEMVAPLLFFASDEASYITGSVLPAGEIGRASCRERVCQYV